MKLSHNILEIVLPIVPLIMVSCGSGDSGKNILEVNPIQTDYNHRDLNGDGISDLIVGAVGGYTNSQDYIYLFYGNKHGLTVNNVQRMRYDQHNAFLTGNINADDFSDLIIAVDSSESTGQVYVHLGIANGIENTSSFVLNGEYTDARFGHCLTVNDFNSDGISDLAVGAPGYGQDRQGCVYIFFGRNNISDLHPDRILEGENSWDGFGDSLSSGDINGDGYFDLAIGASSGKIYIFYGIPNDVNNHPSLVIDTIDKPMPMGSRLSLLVTDIDGNGFEDFIASKRNMYIMPCPPYAPTNDCGTIFDYHIDLYKGASEGLDVDFSTIVSDSSISGPVSAGDIEDDGYMDLAVGFNNSVSIYQGDSSGLNTENVRVLSGEDSFGGTVYQSDLNGDHFDDLVVGAVGTNIGESIGSKGKIYIYYGSPTGITEESLQVIEGENIGDRFGLILPSN